MSDPRPIPPDERRIPGSPRGAWNEKALAQYAAYIAREGEVADDEADESGDAPGLRWALARLVAAGALEVRGRQGRRVRYGARRP